MKRCVTIFHCSGPLYINIWILVILLNLLEKLKLSSDSECPELWFYATYKMFHLKMKWSVKVNFSVHWVTIYICILVILLNLLEKLKMSSDSACPELWFYATYRMFHLKMKGSVKVYFSLHWMTIYIYMSCDLAILHHSLTHLKKEVFFCVYACFEFYLGVFLICSWLFLHLFKVIFTDCSASAGLTGHTIELLVVCVCECVHACVRACVCALYNKDEHADCWTSTSMRSNWFF